MIRLTSHHPDQHHVVIRVEGRLDSPALADFRALLATVAPTTTVTLDLEGLASIDADARDLLVRLRDQGCRLHRASIYVHRLLQEATL
jgi:anti-anti-sigma regulatory factor